MSDVEDNDEIEPKEESKTVPEDPPSSYECSEVVKQYMKDAIVREVQKAIERTIEIEERKSEVRMAGVAAEYESRLRGELQVLTTKHVAEMRNVRDAHEQHILTLKQDHDVQLENTKRMLTDEYEEKMNACEKRWKEYYAHKTKVREKQIACQRDKALRKMAEQCDLQIKSMSDFAERDRDAAVRETNKIWSDFIEEQQAHLLSDHMAQMSALTEGCTSEVKKLMSHQNHLEKRLRRSMRVISENALGRSMARVRPTQSVRRFIQAVEDDESLELETLCPPPVSELSEMKEPASPCPVHDNAATSSPLNGKYLKILGYAHPETLVRTVEDIEEDTRYDSDFLDIAGVSLGP